MSNQLEYKEPAIKNRTVLSWRHLAIAALVLISVIAGIVLPFIDLKFQLVLIAAVPAVIVGVFVIRNPFLGVLMFYLYSFLRPYDFIGALRPLRLTLVLEVLTLTSWAFSLILHKTKIKWGTFSWYYTAFTAAIGVSVITAVNSFRAYEAFMAMLVYFVFFVLATNLVDSIERLGKIIWVLLIIHAYFAAKGTMTFLTGGHIDYFGNATSGVVSQGFIGDENDFALAMNAMIPFAYFGMMYLKGKARIISGILAAGFVLAVVSSFSRGGLVGLVAVIIYCVMVSKRKVLGVVIVAALAGLMVLFAPAKYWDEAESIQNVDEGTANARIRYWTAAGRMFLDYPVIGVGADNGGIHLPQYIRGVRNPNTEWGRAFHGTMPQVLAEMGSIGMFCYLAMLFVALKQLFRIRNRKIGEGGDQRPTYLATSIIGAIIAYVTTSTFLSTAYYPHLWTIYTLAMVLVFIVGNEADKTENPTPAPV